MPLKKLFSGSISLSKSEFEYSEILNGLKLKSRHSLYTFAKFNLISRELFIIKIHHHLPQRMEIY